MTQQQQRSYRIYYAVKDLPPDEEFFVYAEDGTPSKEPLALAGQLIDFPVWQHYREVAPELVSFVHAAKPTPPFGSPRDDRFYMMEVGSEQHYVRAIHLPAKED